VAQLRVWGTQGRPEFCVGRIEAEAGLTSNPGLVGGMEINVGKNPLGVAEKGLGVGGSGAQGRGQTQSGGIAKKKTGSTETRAVTKREFVLKMARTCSHPKAPDSKVQMPSQIPGLIGRRKACCQRQPVSSLVRPPLPAFSPLQGVQGRLHLEIQGSRDTPTHETLNMQHLLQGKRVQNGFFRGQDTQCVCQLAARHCNVLRLVQQAIDLPFYQSAITMGRGTCRRQRHWC
jgi:hypothetical protein